MALLRSLEFKAVKGMPVLSLHRLGESMGQSPFNSPTVFNYYLAEYVPLWRGAMSSGPVLSVGRGGLAGVQARAVKRAIGGVCHVCLRL